MNNAVTEKLREIVARYGWDTLSKDQRRLEDLLSGACPGNRAEVNVLMSAVREGMVADLLASDPAEPKSELLTRLAGRLVRDLALAEEAASWGAKSWARALCLAGADEAPTAQPPASSNAADEFIKRGDELEKQGNDELAHKAYEQAVSVLLPLSQTSPEDTDLQEKLAAAYEKLASVSDAREALETWEHATEIRGRLVMLDPGNNDRQWAYSVGLGAISKGILLVPPATDGPQSAQSVTRARDLLRQSIAAMERLTAAVPNNVKWQEGLAGTYFFQACVLAADLEQKRTSLERAASLYDHLAKSAPDELVHQLPRWVANGEIGNIYMGQHDYSRARHFLERGLELWLRFSDSCPDETAKCAYPQAMVNNLLHLYFEQEEIRLVLQTLRSVLDRIEKLPDVAVKPEIRDSQQETAVHWKRTYHDLCKVERGR